MASSSKQTAVTSRLKQVDLAAVDALTPRLYQKVRNLARQQLRWERPGHTLQATELLHEIFVKLARQYRLDWQNSDQLFGLAARLMRRHLLEHARARNTIKREGQMHKLPLEAALEVSEPPAALDILLLDEAHTTLERISLQLRHLLIRWEKLAENYLGFVELAVCLIVWRKLESLSE